MVAIPSSVDDTSLEHKVSQVFDNIGVEVGERDIQSCHWLKKDKSRTISNDCRVKVEENGSPKSNDLEPLFPEVDIESL